MTDWKEIESKYYLHVVNRQPIVLVRGEGTKVWDDEGNEYLDFTSGWAVTNIGHANPVLAEAIAEPGRHPDPDLEPVLHRPAAQARGASRRE